MKPSLENLKNLTNIEVEGIDHSDAPDYVDAFISYTERDGKPLTDAELDEVNAVHTFVYDQVIKQVY